MLKAACGLIVVTMFLLERPIALKCFTGVGMLTARLAQSAERKALNLVVVGSSPTVGDLLVKARMLGELATKGRFF